VDLGDQFRHAIGMYFKVAFPLFVIAPLVETVLIYQPKMV